MKKILLALLALTMTVAAFGGQITNKEKAVRVLNAIETGDAGAVAFINQNNYTQHNLAVEDGLAGFGKVLQALNGSGKVEVVRAFEDGDYVVAHTKYEFFGPKIGIDVFRFENGLIVEHWDNLQEVAEKTASNRTQIDGPTIVLEKDKTEENKKLVRGLIEGVFMGKDANAKITDYISVDKYNQHNPGVKDGLAGIGEALESLAKAGTPMIYEKNHMIIGEGNFVLSVSEGQFLGKKSSFYDIFRIENGKITEHWDTIEEIPSKDKWANNNGKF